MFFTSSSCREQTRLWKSGKDGAAKIHLQLKRPERGTAVNPNLSVKTNEWEEAAWRLHGVEHLQWKPEPQTELLEKNRDVTEDSKESENNRKLLVLGLDTRCQRQPSPKIVFLQKTQRHTAERQRRTQQAATKHFPQKKKILWWNKEKKPKA